MLFPQTLQTQIRDRFHHVAECPYQGARIFFENAGGSLTLKSVVQTNAKLSAIPDNQGRANPASQEMMRLIAKGRDDMRTFLGAGDGPVFVGESGTECLFRVIRAAVWQAADSGGGSVIGGTLEHPATASAAKQCSARAGLDYIAVPHNAQTGAITADDYRRYLRADTRVATVIQASPVSGMATDVAAVAAVIREVAPECIIVVDGIQHAPHGEVCVADYDVDAYAVSAYKVFSRHNYGFAWVSSRLACAPHERLDGTAADVWELGTRDVSEYATFSEVAEYLAWLGRQFVDSDDRRECIVAAGRAIVAHEKSLLELMLHGDADRPGLTAMPRVQIIGGLHPMREGLVSLRVDGMPSPRLVAELGERGVRVHLRKSDHYSANILRPLGWEDCIRVSLAHYNTVEEVGRFLEVMGLLTPP